MIYVTQKKLHAKKEEKLQKRFWDRPLPPPQSWWTDGRTDRRTTDKSALEKLRCLSAGGAKKRKKKLSIDQKWREMWSKVIFGHPKWVAFDI